MCRSMFGGDRPIIVASRSIFGDGRSIIGQHRSILSKTVQHKTFIKALNIEKADLNSEDQPLFHSKG
ncbi:hypothetical protein [Psychrobacillus sp. NPDC096623]|uniref:hypothetical protein n=1 Tax=Psychrobacillus sp. NPDC096623 TaxID=3364492 RepID=UPI0037F707A1